MDILASTMLTGPDSHVMAAFPGDGPGRRWSHCPGTTIPPWGHRVSHNLKQADTLAPGLGMLLFPLAGLGFLFSLMGRLKDRLQPARDGGPAGRLAARGLLPQHIGGVQTC